MEDTYESWGGASERISKGEASFLCLELLLQPGRDLLWGREASEPSLVSRAEQRILGLVRATEMRRGICLNFQGFREAAKTLTAAIAHCEATSCHVTSNSTRKRINL